MELIRTFLIAGLILTSATSAFAKGMSVRVCNRGELAISTAVAHEDSNLTSNYWVAAGWFTVSPNTCRIVYRDSTLCDYTINFSPCARVRLVYWFKDSTGVEGMAEVGDSRFPPGNETMCVTGTDAFNERRSAPSDGCNRPGWFLVPAAVKIDTYRGDGERTLYSDRFTGTTLDVALGRRDRARPFPGLEARAVAQGPGTSDEFVKLLKVAMNAGPKLLGPGGNYQLSPGYRWVNVCASRQVVSRESLSNSSTPRAKAITNAVRQYLATHGKGTTGFRVVEPNGAIALEPFDGNTADCVRRDDLQFRMESAEAVR